MYSGPVSSGKPIYTGYMPGSEAVMTGGSAGGTQKRLNKCDRRCTAGRQARGLQPGGRDHAVPLPRPPKPDYDYKTFDFDRDIHLLDDWSKQADAKDPDLSKFRKHGGKLLMTDGWADSILQPMMGVNYYEQAVAKNGPGTTEFFRLFMVPGMAHCGGGIGPDRHDPMTAIIDWVEKGKAPDSISREPGRQQPGGAHTPAVPLSAGGALLGPGQHRRRGQFPLRSSLTWQRWELTGDVPEK